MIRSLLDAVESWGATEKERSADYPCDRFVPAPDRILFRAVTVKASPGTVFRWLCQLRVAPYSYDWIDNFGRRSPRHLVPGLDDLGLGQRFMGIFTLVDFEANRHVTLRTDHFVFGEIGCTYLVAPAPSGSRLVAKLRGRFPRSPLGLAMRSLLPAGDLVMMRKQLLTLGSLAEIQERRRPNSEKTGATQVRSVDPVPRQAHVPGGSGSREPNSA